MNRSHNIGFEKKILDLNRWISKLALLFIQRKFTTLSMFIKPKNIT